jgi:hypothetical protein
MRDSTRTATAGREARPSQSSTPQWAPPGSPGSGPQAYAAAAGRMFWLTWKTLSGSYFAFTRARRS